RATKATVTQTATTRRAGPMRERTTTGGDALARGSPGEYTTVVDPRRLVLAGAHPPRSGFPLRRASAAPGRHRAGAGRRLGRARRLGGAAPGHGPADGRATPGRLAGPLLRQGVRGCHAPRHLPGPSPAAAPLAAGGDARGAAGAL